jgi:hypothetical protein
MKDESIDNLAAVSSATADRGLLDRWVGRRLKPDPAERWRLWRVGDGQIAISEDGLRLLVPRGDGSRYSNAQLDDYVGLPRSRFPWQPPLCLRVRARFSRSLYGTAGFGFWNHPFAPNTGVGALPRALWFFHASPPNDLPIALDVPGNGFKAATIDALRARALRWIPAAPAVVLLNQWEAAHRRVWPRVQRDLGIAEAPIDAASDDWHDYRIDWRRDRVTFSIDDQIVLETDRAPGGSLGFVAWIDTQYAIATPRGRLGWGVLPVREPQWIDIAHVAIEPLQ